MTVVACANQPGHQPVACQWGGDGYVRQGVTSAYTPARAPIK